MFTIQPHYHGIARTTQDYERMADAGVVAVAEPAFWAGFERLYPETFIDYFRQISEFEPTRAADYGIRHFCWVAVNPKEAENPELSRAVIERMPEFFDRPNVLGVGETGLHLSSKNECQIMEEQVDLAIRYNQLLLVHTPHLKDKLRGTKKILEILKGMPVNPDLVWIDHVEEHTIEIVKDAGYWLGFTLYPITKCSPKRAVDMLEKYGTERTLVNSSADWGVSDPTALRKTADNMKAAGFADDEIKKVVFDNPMEFFGQCDRFKPRLDLTPLPIESFQR